MHRAVPSDGYQAVELTGTLGRLDQRAGDFTPDTVSTGGKLTVCASPARAGDTPCVTFDIAARFRVYRRD